MIRGIHIVVLVNLNATSIIQCQDGIFDTFIKAIGAPHRENIGLASFKLDTDPVLVRSGAQGSPELLPDRRNRSGRGRCSGIAGFIHAGVGHEHRTGKLLGHWRLHFGPILERFRNKRQIGIRCIRQTRPKAANSQQDH